MLLNVIGRVLLNSVGHQIKHLPFLSDGFKVKITWSISELWNRCILPELSGIQQFEEAEVFQELQGSWVPSFSVTKHQPCVSLRPWKIPGVIRNFQVFGFSSPILAMGSAYSWGSLLLCTMQGKSFCVCLRLHHLLLDSLISHSRTHYIHRRQCDALWPSSPVLPALAGPLKQGWWNVLSVEGFFFQETSLKQPWVCIVKCISEHNV